jgi:hypothetical protein
VAVCCSSASLRALLISAYDGAGGALGLAVRSVPHSSQNFACGRFSCWHRGHGIPSVSRVRIVSTYQGLRVTAPGSPPKLGVPAVPWGTGAPTLPRPGLGRQMGGSGVVRPGVCGATPWAAPTSQNSRLRHAPDGYTPSWRPDPHPPEAPPEPTQGDLVEPPGDHSWQRACRIGRIPSRTSFRQVTGDADQIETAGVSRSHRSCFLLGSVDP